MSPRPDLGPKLRLGYIANPIARAGERRTDAAFLAAAATDPRAASYVIGGELVVMRKTADGIDPLFTFAQAGALGASGESVFLGLLDGAARFAVALDRAGVEAAKNRPELVVADLRSITIQGLVGVDHLAQIAEAKALWHWHARHRFCANCGQPTTVVHAGWRRDCPSCGAEHFPRTDPVVIMLAISGERCLLGRQARFQSGMWSCLAGFVEPGETIEDAVRRETLEEAGVPCGKVKYFACQPWPFPMSLMIGCHAEALSTAITIDRTELEDVRWFDREEVALMLLRRHPEGRATPPPFAIAHHIIRAWVEDQGVLG
ncbi:MAG: NAD(+) diphosphatase [Xanthobacteraceae bacterium]|jgi:NAD+ diphosphatase